MKTKHIITIATILLIAATWWVVKPKSYELNGYIPKTNIVHSEIGAEK